MHKTLLECVLEENTTSLSTLWNLAIFKWELFQSQSEVESAVNDAHMEWLINVSLSLGRFSRVLLMNLFWQLWGCVAAEISDRPWLSLESKLLAGLRCFSTSVLSFFVYDVSSKLKLCPIRTALLPLPRCLNWNWVWFRPKHQQRKWFGFICSFCLTFSLNLRR